MAEIILSLACGFMLGIFFTVSTMLKIYDVRDKEK